MIKNWIYMFIIMLMACLITYADSSNVDNEISSDSTKNLDSVKQQISEKSETKKEKRRRKRREKIVIDKEASIAIHKSMLSTANHKHGFSHLKRRRGKGPLKPQTFCPVMGGPIDTTVHVDYKGMRIYFCCEGCKYNFKLTPNLYIKTLKRYGERPLKLKSGK